MEPRWQCKVDGNMDLVATSYDGKIACSNQYNTENGVHYEDMMAAERDACVFFHIERIEAAVKAGKTFTIGKSGVPIVDGTKEANKDPKTAFTCYVPVPKNPHGVNTSPDGKYYVCAGKLSPTATVIQHDLILKWFEGGLKEPRDTVVAEPEIGLGPLHTGFDGKGSAYTTCSWTARSSNGAWMPPSRPSRATRVPRWCRTVSTCTTSRAMALPPWAKPRNRMASTSCPTTSSPRTATCRLARCTRKMPS
jgi:nitrous oxide reductase